jgi:hypothetical protein
VKDVVLMRTTPVIKREEILPPYRDRSDYAEWYYVVSSAAEARLVAAFKQGGKLQCEILVDDVVLTIEGTPSPQTHPKDGRVWWRHNFPERERKLVDAYKAAALPFVLRFAEEPK